jgi:hypothetical protein
MMRAVTRSVRSEYSLRNNMLRNQCVSDRQTTSQAMARSPTTGRLRRKTRSERYSWREWRPHAMRAARPSGPSAKWLGFANARPSRNGL